MSKVTVRLGPNVDADALRNVAKFLEENPEAKVRVRGSNGNGKSSGPEGIDDLLSAAKTRDAQRREAQDKINAYQNEQAMEAIKSQAEDNATQRFFTTLTNKLKSMHETLMAIIRNM